MARDDSELDYNYLAQNALRGVVRDVLSTTEALGAPPGGHYFVLEFATTAPGVQVSNTLRAQYPSGMRIVLQHQFEDLVVHDDRFEVTLLFKGNPDRLVIPFAAVYQFADPSVNFSLMFPMDEIEAARPGPDDYEEIEGVERLASRRAKPSSPKDGGDDDPDDDGPDGPPQGGGADIVSIDRFRKK